MSETSPAGDASLEIAGGVATVTLRRPARRNALSTPMAERTIAALDAADADPDVRVVVLTGEPPAFCAGADLTDFDESPDRGGFLHAYHRLVDTIAAVRPPVMAFVNGPALGAGCQLVCQCDLRVAAATAPLGIPAARIGLMLDPVNLNRLITEIGPSAARLLLLTGKPVTGDDAVRLGIVHRSVADEDAAAAAGAWAAEIAAQAPLSVQGHKAAVRAVVESWWLQESAPAYARIIEHWQSALGSEDIQEGVRAFAERRDPRFSGR